jgi:hypothetical protein
MDAAHDSVSAAPTSRNPVRHSMGDALRLEGTRHASMSESGRIVPANHRLESGARGSLSGGLDFERTQSGSLFRD